MPSRGKNEREREPILGKPLITGPLRITFRCLVEVFVPEAERLDAREWAEVLTLVEGALASRPAADRRRVAWLLRLLRWFPLPRHGRSLPALPRRHRERLLQRLQASRLEPVRRGVWGLRTLAFLGYYGRREAAAGIGYRADPGGWGARL